VCELAILGSRMENRFTRYANTIEARRWLDRNWARVEALFSNVRIRDFVFEPIKDVFSVRGRAPADAIRSVITRVAVVNAVLAGLPGKLGIGVAVSIALEAWMAFEVARHVGLDIRKPSAIWKYLGLVAASAVTIFWAFKAMLGLGFSLFSFVLPGINPMIASELLVTNFVGVVFWIGFDEARERGSFRLPKRAMSRAWTETKALFAFQFDILKRNLTPASLAKIAGRARAWLVGEIPVDEETLRGDLAATVAMAYLLSGQYERLQGPLGREFLESIRDRYPDLAHASVETISEHMRQYGADQLAGVVNLVKGKLFERLVARLENQDGDAWRAYVHDDESYPGSDMLLKNDKGEVLEISLKATDSPAYIEHALVRYPNIPILSTSEVGEAFAGNRDVTAHPLSNSELTEITEDNFDRLLEQVSPATATGVAAGGVATSAVAKLWPFTIAYFRGRIRYEQLQHVFQRVLGESGVSLTARVSYGLLLGPVFAWYLLARGVLGLTAAAEGTERIVGRLATIGPSLDGPSDDGPSDTKA
jgi:hypothetical protein